MNPRYLELTVYQRRLVDAFVSIRPELRSASSISRKKIEELWPILYESRSSGGPIIAYPMWLLRGPKVSRGVYAWPGPDTPIANIPEVSKVSSVTQSEIDEFIREIRDWGIVIRNKPAIIELNKII